MEVVYRCGKRVAGFINKIPMAGSSGTAGQFDKSKYVLVHKISIRITSPSCQSSGQSAHLRRLARAFAARIHEIKMKMKAQIKNVDL